jgi:hypothetical protein
MSLVRGLFAHGVVKIWWAKPMSLPMVVACGELHLIGVAEECEGTAGQVIGVEASAL